MKKLTTKTNFILQIVYQTLIFGVPLFLSPYLTRTLGSVSLGVYSYCYSIASYFSIFMMLGLQTHGCRTIASCSDDEDERKQFYALFVSHVILSIALILIYIGFVIIAGKEYFNVYFILLLFLLSCLFDCTWYYYGKENFKSVIVKNTLVKLAEVLLIVLFVKKSDDLWIYTLIMAGSILIGQFLLVPPILKKHRFYMPCFSDVRPHIKPLVILTISIIAINVYTLLDKTLIGIFIDDNKASVAFYDYSEKIVKLPIAIFGSLGTVLLPKVSAMLKNGKMNDVRVLLRKSSFLLSWMACGACFGLAAISKTVAPIYFGKEFSICGEYMLYLSPLIIIIPFGATVRNSYLIPAGRDMAYLISLVSAAVMNLVINLILIPKIGVIGAIIGTVLSEAFASVLQFLFARKELNVIKYVFDLIPFLVLGIIMYVVVSFVDSHLEAGLSAVIIDIIIGGSLYTFTSILFVFVFHRNIFNEVVLYFKRRRR